MLHGPSAQDTYPGNGIANSNGLTTLHQLLAAGHTNVKGPLGEELPLTTFAASTPIWEWTTEEVESWIKTVDAGRFKYLVLPPKITGAILLRLSSQGLGDLFAMSLRAARGEGEGEAWNATTRATVGANVGRQLFAAVRKEAMRWPGGAEFLEEVQVRQASERQRMEQDHNLPPESERHCESFFWGETHPGGQRQQEEDDMDDRAEAATGQGLD